MHARHGQGRSHASRYLVVSRAYSAEETPGIAMKCNALERVKLIRSIQELLLK